MSEQMMAWFLEGGMIGLPKRFFALMEPLGLTFEDLGHLLYLSAAEGRVAESDRLAREAAAALAEKKLIEWQTGQGTVSFVPLFALCTIAMGQQEKPTEPASGDRNHEFAELIKRYEREQGKFLGIKEKQALSQAMQQYGWSGDLLYEMYQFYSTNYRKKRYAFAFFAQMAYAAEVHDHVSFERFTKGLDHDVQKVREVLRRLGKSNNPSEVQREMYAKWHHTWKIPHTLILLACEDTVSADNPSFGYLDRILEGWHALDLHSEEAVAAYRKERSNAKTPSHTDRTPRKKIVSNRHYNAGGPRDLSYLEE